MPPCTDEQRSQGGPQPCNRAGSGLTHEANAREGKKRIGNKTLKEEMSGQLPDLG
jgi:hypothetical protein